MMKHADSLDYNGSCSTEGKALELAQRDSHLYYLNCKTCVNGLEYFRIGSAVLAI